MKRKKQETDGKSEQAAAKESARAHRNSYKDLFKPSIISADEDEQPPMSESNKYFEPAVDNEDDEETEELPKDDSD